MLKYEGISKNIQREINVYVDRLHWMRKQTTEKERQYMFLKFLQSQPINEKQVFDIYTNTTIENIH